MTEAEIFEHCRTSVRAFVSRRVPNASDVDDCVSDVVLRALVGLRQGARPEVLEAWLIGIAKNVLKERYRAKDRDHELPAEVAQEPGEQQLELARTDLPDLPSEYEVLLGKRQLWATLDAATHGLGDGLATIMRAHVRLTVERGRRVVGAELAKELGRPVDIVNRQLQRSRLGMLDAIAALVLARIGRADCAGLCGVLDADQLRAGRRLLLDPERTRAVLKHAAGCATCSTRVDEARDYSRWALGPGLLHLAEDDEERRRALVALLDRVGEGGVSSAQAQAAAALAVPVPLAGPANLAGRLLSSRPALVRKADGVTRFVRDNPDVTHRIVAAATGGIAAAAAIVAAVLGGSDGGGVPPVADAPRAPATTTPGGGAPTVSAPAAVPVAVTAPESTPPPTTTTPGNRVPPADPAPGSSAAAQPPASRTSTTPPPPTTAPPSTAPPPPPSTVPPSTAPPPPPSTVPPSSPPPSTVPPTTAPPSTPPPTIAPPSTPPPTTTTPHPQAITIDATAVSYTTVTISGVGVRDTRQAQALNLAPGAYTLATPAGQRLPFTVTDDYVVRYDPSLEGTLQGGGSAELSVHGHDVTFDVSGVDYYNMAVGGTGFPAPQPVRHLKLLPGPHNVVTANGNSLPFTVTSTGGITFPTDPHGLLTWDGQALAVHGIPITLDATGTDYANMTVSGAGWPAPQAVRTFRLLPGTHTVVASNGNSLPFTLTATGGITFPTDPHGMLTWDGRALAVHGVPITLDATDVDYYNMTISGAGWPAPQAVRTFRLLPGTHSVVTANGNSLPFTITTDGTVGYAAGLEGPLTRADGGKTLQVHGFRVTLDVTDLGYDNTTVSGTGWRTPQAVREFRLLPGTHRVVTHSGTTVAFTVGSSGLVGYDSSLQGLLTGAGGGTLAVHGFPVTIDATGSGYPQFGLEGAGWWDARQPRVLRLLPGTHYALAPGGRRFAFSVTSAGRVTYDAALDSVFAGRDGTTLTLCPPG